MDDRARTRDDPEPAEELLSSASDRRRLDEGLDLGVRRSGAWLRQHPLVVAGVALLLVGGGLLGRYLATRPPPVSPVVDVNVQGVGGGNQYLVVLRTTGEQVLPLGIVGPGLTAPTSTIGRVTSGGPGIGSLGASVDCSDVAWFDADPSDYGARVERLDPYGRTTTTDVPLFDPDPWFLQVRQECLGRAFSAGEPAHSQATLGAGPGLVDVRLQLANPGDHGLLVSAAPYDSQDVSWPEGNLTALAAGGTVELLVPLVAHCAADPSLPAASGAYDSSSGWSGSTIWTQVTTERDASGGAAVVLPAPLAAEDARQVDAMLRASCVVRTG